MFSLDTIYYNYAGMVTMVNSCSAWVSFFHEFIHVQDNNHTMYIHRVRPGPSSLSKNMAAQDTMHTQNEAYRTTLQYINIIADITQWQ